MQLRALADAIELFALERRALPATLDDLTRRGGDGEPYLARVPLDPWRRPYRYAAPDPARREFEVASDGPDGRAGTDDDPFVRRGRATPP